jgi:hypothetical protein
MIKPHTKYRFLKQLFPEYPIGSEFRTDSTRFIVDLVHEGLSDSMNKLMLSTWLATGIIEEVEVKEGWPEDGDRYCYITDADVFRSTWDGDRIDRLRRDSFGIYKTHQEACEMRDYLIQCRKEKQAKK